MEVGERSFGDGEDNGSHWNDVKETIDDPEEIRVLFCALDSFR